MKQTYEVTVTRTVFDTFSYAIEAESEEDAQLQAEARAQGEATYSGNTEYEIDSCELIIEEDEN